jgi:hypothetical protein
MCNALRMMARKNHTVVSATFSPMTGPRFRDLIERQISAVTNCGI